VLKHIGCNYGTGVKACIGSIPIYGSSVERLFYAAADIERVSPPDLKRVSQKFLSLICGTPRSLKYSFGIGEWEFTAVAISVFWRL
jgi:hypothetical protein